MSTLVSILILIITLGVAYALDSMVAFLQSQAGHTLNPIPLILGETAADLVFGILLILFAWLVLIKLERRNLRAIIFVLIGAAVTFYLPFLTFRPDISFIRGSVLFRIHTTFMDLGPGSFLILASAYILVVGLIDFLGLQRPALNSSR